MRSNLNKSRWKVVFSREFNDFSPHIVSANVPGIDLNIIDVPTSMSTINFPGGSVTFNPFIATFAVDEKLLNYERVVDWIFYMRDPVNRINNEKFEQMTLQIYTPDGSLLRREIQFTDVFPVSLSDIELVTVDVDILEVASITFAYRDYSFISLDT